nr:MAG TPA: hypothetical protein [Caudoviricetes sp.]
MAQRPLRCARAAQSCTRRLSAISTAHRASTLRLCRTRQEQT